MKNLDKAAGMLVCLGIDKAAQVLAHLSQDEIQLLAGKIAQMQHIGSDTRKHLLVELKDRYAEGGFSIDPGGIEYVRKLLTETFDGERAEMLLDQLMKSGSSRPFNTFRRIDARRIIGVISNEPPHIVALVLYYLPRDKSAQVLAGLPTQLRQEAVMRLVNIQFPSPHMVSHLEQLLLQRLSEMHGENEEDDVDVGMMTGTRMLVEILTCADHSVERGIYNFLVERDPELADEVRKSIFVFEDIAKLEPRAIQTILREVSSQEIALSLKTASEDFKKMVFSNLSENAAKMAREEVDVLGPVRISIVEEAQQKIIEVVRKLADEGTIDMRASDNEEVLV